MPSQRETLELFTALRLLQPSWAGTLLLGIGLDNAGRALALASLASGAAALFLESDETHLRTAAREGCTTFTVTTLAEALRALKNELRRNQAITVALSGDSAAWLIEIVERGVQPQYFARDRPASQASMDTLETRGARILSGYGLLSSPHAIDLQQCVAAVSKSWLLIEDGAPTLAERRDQDRSMLTAISGEDPIAILTRQWLRTAPALFPRALNRAFWKGSPPSSQEAGEG